jgi:hypothetical protein
VRSASARVWWPRSTPPLVEDRPLYGAHEEACCAIDALGGINIRILCALLIGLAVGPVNALGRAESNAVAGPFANISDNGVGHVVISKLAGWGDEVQVARGLLPSGACTGRVRDVRGSLGPVAITPFPISAHRTGSGWIRMRLGFGSIAADRSGSDRGFELRKALAIPKT